MGWDRRSVSLSVILVLVISSISQAQPMRRGRILTPDNKPLAGAKVILIDRNDFRNFRVKTSAITDADGLFGFTDLPESYNVLVQAPGYAWSHAMVGGPDDERPPESKVMPATALALKLIGPDELPAAGVRVSVNMIRGDGQIGFAMFLPDELQQEILQITDAQGECTFDRLPQSSVIRLSVLDDRYAELQLAHDIILGAKPAADGHIIKLSAAGTVKGRVTIADTGAAAAGVRVWAQSADRGYSSRESVTDADGRYAIKQINPSTYILVLDVLGELGKQYTAVGEPGVQVRAGQTLEGHDFSLITGGLIRGRVFVEGTNQPVSGVHGTIRGPARPSPTQQGITIAADGTFEMRVPPGTSTLSLSTQVPAGLLAPANPTRTLTVANGQVVTTDFVLRPDPTPAITGIVVDTDGKLVADALVLAEFASGQVLPQQRWSKTDLDGRFTVPAVPNGAYVMAAKGRAISVERILVDAETRTFALTIRNDAYAAIRVRVLLPDGSPASSAPVWIMETAIVGGSATSYERKADADGVVLFKTLDPRRKYDVYVSGAGFTRDKSENVQIFPAQTTEITLQTSTIDGFIAGTVVDVNGNPVPDVTIQISGRGSGRGSTRADGAGRFRANGLVPDDSVTVYPTSPDGMSPPTRITVGTENAKVIYDPKPIPPRREAP